MASAEWIKVVEVKDRLSVDILQGEIEIGEAEAIVLAKESVSYTHLTLPTKA